jgi:hypothetical protein
MEIAEYYRGKKTGKGHELRVDERQNEIVIWYLFWGEHEGIDNHHHMGVARVRREGDAYLVGWLRDTQQRPYRNQRFANSDDLFSALDAEIAKR